MSTYLSSCLIIKIRLLFAQGWEWRVWPLNSAVLGLMCILFWHSPQLIRKRVTASRGRKAYVSAIWQPQKQREMGVKETGWERMKGIRGIFVGNVVDISWRAKMTVIFDFNIWFIWLSEHLHPMSQQNRLYYAILCLTFFTHPLSVPLLLRLFSVRPSCTYEAREGGRDRE